LCDRCTVNIRWINRHNRIPCATTDRRLDDRAKEMRRFPSAAKNKNVLVVDNHRLMLEFMSKILTEQGHRVMTAEDGLSAMEILKTFLPDVMFIDLVMPKIGGKKLCRIVRSNPKFKDVFIIILSAIAAEDDPDISDFGADACIAKGPFTKMPGHIQAVFDKMDRTASKELKKRVIGIEDIHARAITKELLSSNRHFERILDNISEGILELTPDGRIIYANPTAAALTGCPEERLLSRSFAGLFSGRHRLEVEKHLGAMNRRFTPILDPSPLALQEKIVSLNFLPVTDDGHRSVVVIVNDITERKRLEAQLQRAEKMEAIGALAGGVAHDLNNILSGLVSYPELLLMEIPEDSPLRKPIATIQRSGEKAVAIVQDLLTLARRGVAVTEVLDLNGIIREYLSSLEFEKLIRYHPRVVVKTDLEENLLNIMGSAVHLSKTVMNLISNASEAMPDGGTVTIATRNRYVDTLIKGYDTVVEGDYVTLTVTDTGYGISPDEIERIFEPFYTKKVMGRSGTGLGMTVVYGTVKDHHGYIDVQSREGQGTCFTLYFPVTREPSAKDRPPVKSEDYAGRGETILVVDDVAEQRDIASGMLTRLGYSVSTVSDGEQAVAYLKRTPVDLVVLDMIMDPGMNGLETYREIIRRHPGQKAIITSGYSETQDVKEAQRIGAGRYIKKPYTMEKIGLAVREELDRKT